MIVAVREHDCLAEVTDIDLLAPEVVLALEREEEDGTTPVHRMLDAAIEAAIENGAEGVKTGQDILDERRRAAGR